MLSFSLPALAAAIAFFSLPRQVTADVEPFRNGTAYMHGAFGGMPRQRYLSDPAILGPVANVVVPPQEGVSPSKYVLWAPGGPHLPTTSPSILDANSLSVVWQGPVLDGETMGPTVQSCNGSDYITWWSGVGRDGFKQGRWYIYDTNYNLKWNITAKGEIAGPSDGHDLFLTPTCQAVITIYKTRPYDLKAMWNFTDGHLMDSYFQEQDLATGEERFTWQSSKHINMTDSAWTPWGLDQGHSMNNGFDWFHLNSVQKDWRGNYLISGRHTWSVYYISGTTGEVIWRFGGNNTDFRDTDPANSAQNFRWQHHARFVDHEGTQVSLFDDRRTAYNNDSEPLSRGILVNLNFTDMTISLNHSWYATQDIKATREGSTQILLDSPTPGNAINGYGEEPGWTEYAPNGTVLQDVWFGPPRINRDSADNYRALKVNWTGEPTWSPKIAPGPKPEYTFDTLTSTFHVRMTDLHGESVGANNTVYFSWNGATDVTSWVILASNTTRDMSVTSDFWAEVRKDMFENSAYVGNSTRFVTVLAIGADDTVLAQSDVLGMQSFNNVTSGTGLDADAAHAWTAQWRSYLSHQQEQAGVLGSVRGAWRTAQDTVAQAPTEVKTGVAAGAVVLILLGAGLICWVFARRGRRARYTRMQDGEAAVVLDADRFRDDGVVFRVGDQDEDEDDELEMDKDEKYAARHDGDIATLRSVSGSSSGSFESKKDAGLF